MASRERADITKREARTVVGVLKDRQRRRVKFDKLEQFLKVPFTVASMVNVFNKSSSYSDMEAWAFTIHLGSSGILKDEAERPRDVLKRARQSIPRYFNRRLERNDLDLWVAVEDRDKRGRKVTPHIHGLVALRQGEYEAAKNALRDAAGGKTAAPTALKMERLLLPVDGMCWANYGEKNFPISYMSRSLTRKGQAVWERYIRKLPK